MQQQDIQRYRPLRGGWRAVLVLFTLAALLLSVNQLANLQFFVGVVLLENRYLYLLLAAFLPLCFLLFPARKRAREKVPWYDVALFLAALASCLFFAWNAERILHEGWEVRAPVYAVAASVVLWALLLEGARRTGGLTLMAILLLFSLYPIVAGRLPGPIAGFNLSFGETAIFHATSVDAVMGIPMRTFGMLIIGFILFGLALQHTGGGRFFTDLAMSLLGGFRGGGAKVAVVASALFGTMSGSAISNVLSTGSATIPAMKQTGFRPEDAAAIEANTSTGGVLTPPVMGAVAFLMVAILGVAYSQVMLAAAVPAFLFYYGMFCQIDGYAARRRLRGLPRQELPSLSRTIRDGWVYIFAFAALIYLLLYLQQEALAPFYTTGLLILLAMGKKETRLTFRGAVEFLAPGGRILTEVATVLAAVGLLIGSLFVSGVVTTFTSDVLRMAGGNVTVLLVLGALTSFVLGTALPVTASYLLLAIMLVPALVQQGMNPMAVHMFVLYWAVLADVTPPVAFSVVAASSIARSSLMPSMMAAMQFGAAKYLLPFFFVYAPALLFQGGSPLIFLEFLVSAVVGLALLSYALQGYLPWIGSVKGNLLGYAVRALLMASGLLLAFPERLFTFIGLGIAVVAYGAVALGRGGRRLALIEPSAAGPVPEKASPA